MVIQTQGKRMPGAERRIQALAAAREIISKDGIGSLTMSALADAVRVTKPIIYRHFSSSEAVAIALMKDYCEGSTAYSLKCVTGSRTIYEFFDRLIDSLFEYVASEGPLLRSITNGFVSSPKIDAFYLQERDRSVTGYRTLLLEQKVGETEATIGAYALTEMINQAVLEFAPLRDRKHCQILKRMAQGALRTLVAGEGVRPTIPETLLAPWEG